eukprot:5734970-Pyramimonas_sp.AAC.1
MVTSPRAFTAARYHRSRICQCGTICGSRSRRSFKIEPSTRCSKPPPGSSRHEHVVGTTLNLRVLCTERG